MRVIIIGGNKTVYFLARQFVQRHSHVTIINRDPIRSKELAEQTKATVVLGEGTDVGRLEEAGAMQADVLLALTSHDQDNLIACQIAQKRYGIPRTIAIVNDPDNEAVFHQLGVTVAFSTTRIIANIIEQETTFDDITSMMALAQGHVMVTDIRLDQDSPAVGQSLIELDLSNGTLVACVIRNDDYIVPRGATRLQAGDHLLLISRPEHQERDLVLLCGKQP
jgi:trk system potassium uptake protein TrkA